MFESTVSQRFSCRKIRLRLLEAIIPSFLPILSNHHYIHLVISEVCLKAILLYVFFFFFSEVCNSCSFNFFFHSLLTHLWISSLLFYSLSSLVDSCPVRTPHTALLLELWAEQSQVCCQTSILSTERALFLVALKFKPFVSVWVPVFFLLLDLNFAFSRQKRCAC